MNRLRQRTPSGHDIPIPESVFVHLGTLDQKIEAVETRVSTKLDAVEASVQTLSTKLDAGRSQTMLDLAKILIPAVVAIVGGQRLLTPAPEPQRIEVHQTPVDPRMAECLPHKPGTAEQIECFARVQAEIQSGKRPAP
jgi:hypothetical protein